MTPTAILMLIGLTLLLGVIVSILLHTEYKRSRFYQELDRERKRVAEGNKRG